MCEPCPHRAIAYLVPSQKNCPVAATVWLAAWRQCCKDAFKSKKHVIFLRESANFTRQAANPALLTRVSKCFYSPLLFY